MTRGDISELYYITPISNVPSIMTHGILSHSRAKQILHHSVAMPEIQEKRKNKRIPSAGWLHDYANLYFDAHNAMLSKIRAHNDEICVIRVDTAVLDISGVIIADRNASSDWVRFGPVNEGLASIDKDRLFNRFWLHSDDPIDEMRHKSEKCAEVLVPNTVDPRFIIGLYLANNNALELFNDLNIGLTACIRSNIFF